MIKFRFAMGCFGILVVSLILLMACRTHNRDITGRWQEIGAQATLVFYPDGSFAAVDNQGMHVNGVYRLNEDGRVQFDVRHPDGSIETIQGQADLSADVLTFTPEDHSGIERYRRVP